MRRLKLHLTFANVTSLLALFVALGGTSYAVASLPRNSVGPLQMRRDSVTSSKIKARSVLLSDLSLRTRRSLRGTTGPAGPMGPAATRYFASVSASGGLVRGNATSGGSTGGPGNYVVGFAASVSACAYSATLGSTDTSPTTPGRITVSDQGGRVGVQTFDAAGAAADLPFHLLVAC